MVYGNAEGRNLTSGCDASGVDWAGVSLHHKWVLMCDQPAQPPIPVDLLREPDNSVPGFFKTENTVTGKK